MARRRANDEGSIFKDKNGIWWAQLPADEQGKRPKRRAASRKEAVEKLRQLQKEREQGLNLSIKMPTVEAFVAIWLEQVVKRSVRENTHDGYTKLMRYYVIPHIGALHLNKLNTPLIQHMVNTWSDEGYAVGSIHTWFTRVKMMLDVAISYGYIVHNPAAGVRLPKQVFHEPQVLSVAEWQILRHAIAKHRNTVLYDVCFFLALRRGEGLGLMWADIDWKGETIQIRRQVQRLNGVRTLVTVKTESSERTLPLPPRLLERLHWQWKNQQEERTFQGTEWKEQGLIFQVNQVDHNHQTRSQRNLATLRMTAD